MDHSDNHDERQPLLQSDDAHPGHLAGQDATDSRPKHFAQVAILGTVILVAFNIALQLINLGRSQLIEGAICQQEFHNVTQPYQDARCKYDTVQQRLSLILAWESTFSMIVSLFTTVPYAMVAQRYGARVVTSLLWLGYTFSLGGETIISLYPAAFDMRLICIFPLFTLIGGGDLSVTSMRYLIAGSIATESSRSTVFFYASAIAIITSFVSGPLGYAAMTRGPLFSQLVGLGIIAGLVPLSLAFPSEIGKTVLSPKNDATDGDDSRQTASPSLWKQGVVIVRDMLYRDWQLTVILIGFMFTVLGRYEVILRFQYATKRYGWSWGDASLLSSLDAIINLSMVTVVLPATARILLRYKFTPTGKDVWLARGSAMAYVLGSVACAAAPNGTAFTVAVAIYEFSKGYPPAIASVIASVAEKAGIVQHSAVYATVATAEGIGAIISGPVIAGAFNVGLQWGGAWYGLPFWICSLLYLVAAVIIFNVRATKVE